MISKVFFMFDVTSIFLTLVIMSACLIVAVCSCVCLFVCLFAFASSLSLLSVCAFVFNFSWVLPTVIQFECLAYPQHRISFISDINCKVEAGMQFSVEACWRYLQHSCVTVEDKFSILSRRDCVC